MKTCVFLSKYADFPLSCNQQVGGSIPFAGSIYKMKNPVNMA